MTDTRPLTLLWLIGLDHVSGMRHGGNLRWFNLSRELIARGHTVYFAINGAADRDLPDRIEYLNELKQGGFLSGHFVLDYPHRQARSWVARTAAYHPRLLNRLLQAPRAAATRAIGELARQHRVDAVIVSDRAFLFLTETLGGRPPVLVDWVDSFVLYFRRALAMHLRDREPLAALGDLRTLVPYYLQERHYGRRAALNLLASPVDKQCLDAITGTPRLNHALVNGLSLVERRPPAREPARLIFTGNMNFPPNYEAAIWFIDKVLPTIRARRPDVVFAVAGRNPVLALLARAAVGVEILGDVPDIHTEIARSALCLAAADLGRRLKNKVIEAISCDTFVVSTERGVEFLDESLRKALLIADSPAGFARTCSTSWRTPSASRRGSRRSDDSSPMNIPGAVGQKVSCFALISPVLVS